MVRTSGTAPDLLTPPTPAPADASGRVRPASAESPRPDRLAHLRARLEAEPWSFDFYAAVRALEALEPERRRVGTSVRVSEDAVRFGQEPSLAFAPATVWRFEPSRTTPWGAVVPDRLLVNFLGLLGPQGPMPLHLTEFIRDRARNHHDHTLARFLDLFHHRIISLFYRAWAQARQTVDYDRAAAGDEGRWVTYVGSLIGLGLPGVRHRDDVPDETKLHFAGRLAPQVRNAEGLRAIVEKYFGVPTEIEEFVGRWLDLPERHLCRLGSSPDSAGLGTTAILGARAWDCQGMFRLRLGPMTLADYERLLPGSRGQRRLRDWIRLYLCDELAWEARLVLLEREVPRLSLGRTGRLGWTTWLATGPLGRDPADLALRGLE